MLPHENTVLPVRARLAAYADELLHFTIKNARSCIFPVFIFGMLAVSQVAPLPMARYDFLLFACIGMQFLMLATGLETRDELKVITLFHLLGLGLELFKVHSDHCRVAVVRANLGGLHAGFQAARHAARACVPADRHLRVVR